jgi:hypothetical protein
LNQDGEDEENVKAYIVLSLSGQDSSGLKTRFKTEKSYQKIFKLGKSVLRSLQKLHSLGYIHAGMHSDNII